MSTSRNVFTALYCAHRIFAAGGFEGAGSFRGRLLRSPHPSVQWSMRVVLAASFAPRTTIEEDRMDPQRFSWVVRWCANPSSSVEV